MSIVQTSFVSCVLLACLFAQPAAAKKLYSYQDENGSWHFSDRKPDTDVEVTVVPIKIREHSKKVYVRQVGERKKPSVEVQNLYAGPIEIEFRLQDAVNTFAEPSLPRSFIIPARATVDVFKLFPQNPAQSWSYSFTYKYVPGSPRAQHTQTDDYNPPYSHGASYRVTQSFDGEFSHTGPQNRYAVDFAMPDGSLVHAARGGVVMDVARDFYSGGVDREKFGTRANFIRILHDDGTIAMYAHLRWESVLVVPGRRIRRGELIAKSGSTGYSSGPHLHFAIQKNAGMELVSIPFRFQTANQSSPVIPQVGDLLIAQ